MRERGRSQSELASHLPLLEGVSGQVASARRLEQRDVPPGLDVPLLLQPGQRPRPEEDLREDKDATFSRRWRGPNGRRGKIFVTWEKRKTRF